MKSLNNHGIFVVQIAAVLSAGAMANPQSAKEGGIEMAWSIKTAMALINTAKSVPGLTWPWDESEPVEATP